jgi:uncharacterized repeat protein (TIGR03803 family)
MRVFSIFSLAALVLALCACGGHGSGFSPSLSRSPSGETLPDASSPYAILHVFTGKKNGAFPAGSLMLQKGTIFATTALGGSSTTNCYFQCGTIFSMAATGASFKILYKFLGNNDGVTPSSNLVMDQAGALYGSTLGGSYHFGIVYKLVNTKGTWKKTTLHIFTGGADMDSPSALVLDAKTSTLYGTAKGVTDTDCCGSVFSIRTDGTGYKILHTFKPGNVGHGSNDGANPTGGLVEDASGALYGATSEAGKVTTHCLDGCGTIFKLTPKGGSFAFSVVYAFLGGSDGQSPQSPLALSPAMQGGQAVLYGSANGGGTPNCLGTGSMGVGCGTVFKLTGGSVTTLYAFQGASVYDGEFPESGVTLVGSNLFGVTRLGGGKGLGELYRVSTDGKSYRVLHSFDGGSDGASPFGQPAFAGNTLYASTSEGGGNSCDGTNNPGCGTIFRYKI